MLVLALTLIAALGIITQQAMAFGSYIHGDVVNCEACHLYGHTLMIPTNEDCINCHAGYQVPSRSLTCWTCHTPGQDMSGARDDAACTAACHLAGGTTVTHVAHKDRPATCSVCHPLTTSPTDANGSPHHTVPAPLIAGLAPGSGRAGNAVTLTGSHFTSSAVIGFNGSSAAFTVVSDTQITATVPAGATSGPVTVLTGGGTATSATIFTIVADAHVTLRLTPTSLALTKTVRASGLLSPVGLAGESVRLSVQFRTSGRWVVVRTVSVPTKAGGEYSRIYRPAKRGSYRVKASVGWTNAHTAAGSAWIAFRVR